ncbi:prephenate dehydratase [Bacillus sp. FJAT-45350]|uniref:prephenate dehydratase n=1 Tax=Bacillus sp. FJAT-45350 TaxID=2011014 RepID=UPI000BB6F466|nr:prephenate dehydratase [Bacillus sp. FJAT-45350]
MNTEKGKQIIGYLGPIGTFTEMAVKQVFKLDTVNSIPFNSIPECLYALNQNQTDYTVVPIENSIGGSVYLTLDWLIHEISTPIQGEVRIPIEQHLLAHEENKNIEREKFSKVFSHPQALRQCSKYIRDNLPNAKVVYVESTAEGAKHIMENPEEPWLAIANEQAKKIYGLSLLENNIEDYQTNTTRFLFLSNKKLPITSSDRKSSILVSLPKEKNIMLHQVLEIFAENKLDLTKIESAPRKTAMGDYYYFLDFKTSGNDKELLFKQACNKIQEIGCHIRSFGTYPCISKKSSNASITYF